MFLGPAPKQVVSEASDRQEDHLLKWWNWPGVTVLFPCPLAVWGALCSRCMKGWGARWNLLRLLEVRARVKGISRVKALVSVGWVVPIWETG